MFPKLNIREKNILEIINSNPRIDIHSIEKQLEEETSRPTLNRDIEKLLELNLIERIGKARATSYVVSILFKLLEEIDVDKYFAVEEDKRVIRESFNFEIFETLISASEIIFSKKESEHINNLNQKYLINRNELSETLIKKEFERLTIELAWKSSKIEGNTYSLLDTETLIKSGIEAKGHNKEEATMLLNHKKALEYINEKPKNFQKITTNKIEELHSILIEGLEINQKIRNKPVGITGTRYRPLDNQFQIKEALDQSAIVINQTKNILTKSLLASALISYLQAFEDGNKRTSRLLSNSILMANDYCPLSFRSIDETEYKKAIILFYEQNNLSYLKDLFLEQFEFAVSNYWL